MSNQVAPEVGWTLDNTFAFLVHALVESSASVSAFKYPSNHISINNPTKCINLFNVFVMLNESKSQHRNRPNQAVALTTDGDNG